MRVPTCHDNLKVGRTTKHRYVLQILFRVGKRSSASQEGKLCLVLAPLPRSFAANERRLPVPVVNDSIATRVALGQFFNLLLSGLEGFNRINPVRPVFSKPENIKSLLHFFTTEPNPGRVEFLGRLRPSLGCLTRGVVKLRMASLNRRNHVIVQCHFVQQSCNAIAFGKCFGIAVV